MVTYCMKWYISEDMMPFGGEYVMIWKEFLGYQIFFVIFIKHGYYFSGSWAQVLIVINSELHWF